MTRKTVDIKLFFPPKRIETGFFTLLSRIGENPGKGCLLPKNFYLKTQEIKGPVGTFLSCLVEDVGNDFLPTRFSETAARFS